ncbi:protein kinase [Gemmatirosa kalamazoonensis]|uniref:Protein kinase n=1 Tax=Gemmatirosa kalamazoonensis TaxID=861299 RepID=W0RAA4_9BACT|nr:serine/threonine-protein kinase [Gemmatirosa kalamazoonensis]AHG88049.1 protein kinase [Gemmatirosa kalamazoonensis]
MSALLSLPTPIADVPADPDAERVWLADVFAADALGAQYQLVRELGRGGMGVVVLARDLALHRVVAIKLMRRELALLEDERTRFQREARLMARLTHPSIVPVHAFGEVTLGAERVPYFVMRHVDGESLAERLRREGTLKGSEVRRILGELALALDYAHHEGVVHRDLKPENVLLERSSTGAGGRVILTDFGVAALPSYDAQPMPGFSMGTPQYMSPEQLVGEHAIDRRSDLYALGVLGFTLLTGRPPFGGRTLRELSARHLLQRVPALARLAPDAPTSLVAVIERCLAKDPAARFDSGRELHDALERGAGFDWKRWTSALRAAVI